MSYGNTRKPGSLSFLTGSDGVKPLITGREINKLDASNFQVTLGSPTSGTLTQANYGAFDSTTEMGAGVVVITLTGARIPVTDGAGSGSHGSLKLFDFPQGSVRIQGAIFRATAYSPDGTGVPNDAAFEIGVGTSAISAAADGDLGGSTNENIIGALSQTLSGGTTTGFKATSVGLGPLDGSSSAGSRVAIYLNWSGTAATIDGNGTIDVTGTFAFDIFSYGDP